MNKILGIYLVQYYNILVHQKFEHVQQLNRIAQNITALNPCPHCLGWTNEFMLQVCMSIYINDSPMSLCYMCAVFIYIYIYIYIYINNSNHFVSRILVLIQIFYEFEPKL